MNLVDILARELKEWPKFVIEISRHGGAWIHHGPSDPRFNPELPYCPDLPDFSEGVKRPQWQAAVDALKAGEQAWDGEGLPPVGTVCEFAGGTPCPEDPFDKDLKEGMQVTIIAHFKSGDFTLAAFTFDPQNPDRGMVQVEQGNFGCFRPARTAEQIAEQAHREAVEELAAATNWMLTREACELVLEAGYRKQEVQQ